MVIVNITKNILIMTFIAGVMHAPTKKKIIEELKIFLNANIVKSE